MSDYDLHRVSGAGHGSAVLSDILDNFFYGDVLSALQRRSTDQLRGDDCTGGATDFETGSEGLGDAFGQFVVLRIGGSK